MIEKTHLRLGNKLHDTNGVMVTVSRVDNNDQYVGVLENDERYMLNDDLSGIPLWCDDGEDVSEHVKPYLKTDNYGIWVFDREDELGHKLKNLYFSRYDETQIKIWYAGRFIGIIRCQYVHQLQNIVFVFCGVELFGCRQKMTYKSLDYDMQSLNRN